MPVTIVVILGIAYLLARHYSKKRTVTYYVDNDDTKTPSHESPVLQTFKCESCGASVQIDINKPAAFCQYCGAKLPDAEAVRKEMARRVEADKQRNLEHEKIKLEREKLASIEKTERNNKISDIIDLIMLITLLAFIGVFFYWLYKLIKL